MSKGSDTQKRIRITYVKSAIGYGKDQKATLRALGLHRLGQQVVHVATPSILGMVEKVAHLVQVEEVGDEVA
ncbi:MAG: 50S ribosomal protein L30 [Chloroflexi bacterium]|nr:50S ribosomal protein L30 [Chloroflexota bacterium]